LGSHVEKATGKVNAEMVLSEYSLNAKEKKNLERQQQLETQEFTLQDRQTTYDFSSIVYSLF
jgi:hypothetical protein